MTATEWKRRLQGVFSAVAGGDESPLAIWAEKLARMEAELEALKAKATTPASRVELKAVPPARDIEAEDE